MISASNKANTSRADFKVKRNQDGTRFR